MVGGFIIQQQRLKVILTISVTSNNADLNNRDNDMEVPGKQLLYYHKHFSNNSTPDSLAMNGNLSTSIQLSSMDRLIHR